MLVMSPPFRRASFAAASTTEGGEEGARVADVAHRLLAAAKGTIERRHRLLVAGAVLTEPRVHRPSKHHRGPAGLDAAEQVTDAYITSALRARADEALYLAKRLGRDRVVMWAPGIRSNATPPWSDIVASIK